MKVLIADDDKDLLALIGFTLAQAGYLAVKASDGPSALKAFENEAPDLVVLDINMPGASGFQVCEAIRRTSRVPVMRPAMLSSILESRFWSALNPTNTVPWSSTFP